MKHCPLLKLYKIDIANRGLEQWEKDICLDCPLSERCVFDYVTKITKKDKERLIAYYEAKQNKPDKPKEA